MFLLPPSLSVHPFPLIQTPVLHSKLLTKHSAWLSQISTNISFCTSPAHLPNSLLSPEEPFLIKNPCALVPCWLQKTSMPFNPYESTRRWAGNVLSPFDRWGQTLLSHLTNKRWILEGPKEVWTNAGSPLPKDSVPLGTKAQGIPNA
jgi:hypothetical protein